MNINLVIKKNRKGTEYIENSNGEIIKKRCTICGEIKSLGHFSNHRYGLGGTVSRCKPCTSKFNRDKEYDKNYYGKNKNEIRERRKELDRAYYEKNKEKIAERRKKRYEENKKKN